MNITETIVTRKQLGAYLKSQAIEQCKLAYEKSVLLELVVSAYECRARMPQRWVRRASKAIKDIRE